MKKILSIIMISVILVSSFLVPVAHAEVATATVLVGSAVVGTALTACGIMVASHAMGSNVAVSDAVQQAWAETTETLKTKIRNTVVLTRVGGAVVAKWTKDTWKDFVNWAKARFPSSGADITVGTLPPITWDSTVETFTGTLSPTVQQTVIPYASDRNYTKYDFDITGNTKVGIRRDGTGTFIALLASATSAMLFKGISDSTVLGSGAYPMTVYKPMYNGTAFYIPFCYKWNAIATWTGADVVKNNNNTWYIGAGAGATAYVGWQVVLNNGRVAVRKGANTVNIAGDFTEIGTYIKACVESGLVIGLPLDDGTMNEEKEDTGEPVTIPVGIDTAYYPDLGTMAPPVDIATDSTISIPIPLTGTEDLPLEDGESIPLKDLVGDLPVDLPRIGTQTPSETMPRVDTGTGTVAVPDTNTGSIDIPNEADNTIPNNPTTPSESDDEDTNKLKLPKILLTKFPFCIPWDLFNALKMLRADPVPPKWSWSIKIPAFDYTWNGSIDLTQFTDTAQVIRWLLCAIWIVALILITKSLIK